MKAVICEKPGAPYQVVDNFEVPEPTAEQILVKSIYTALNPVDGMMGSMGILVKGWPLVPGVDAAGVVTKVGESVSTFKVGDEVCGCTRVGAPGHGTCQEFFLMDPTVTIPKPKNLTLLEAATVGVGVETASLAVFGALDVPLPDLDSITEEKDEVVPMKDEWAVVLGGASSVGKFAVQLLNICGFRVIASCSAASAPLVKKQGAKAVFDYKKSVEEQVKDVLSITKGEVHRVFDAVASAEAAFAKALFKELPQGPKFFSTTNDWSGITDFEGGRTRCVELGPVGMPESGELNDAIASYIPIIVALFEKGKLKPSPYDLIGEGGFEDAVEALLYQAKGAGGSNKVVVKLQEK